ncbi:hypothetical protein [Nannocystis pusilla]|uniref:hypothetical protein n=1 Tax=Nannocystis pusilla TaxID=889268 RepID=UPI003DA20ACB
MVNVSPVLASLVLASLVLASLVLASLVLMLVLVTSPVPWVEASLGVGVVVASPVDAAVDASVVVEVAAVDPVLSPGSVGVQPVRPANNAASPPRERVKRSAVELRWRRREAKDIAVRYPQAAGPVSNVVSIHRRA